MHAILKFCNVVASSTAGKCLCALDTDCIVKVIWLAAEWLRSSAANSAANHDSVALTTNRCFTWHSLATLELILHVILFIWQAMLSAICNHTTKPKHDGIDFVLHILLIPLLQWIGLRPSNRSALGGRGETRRPLHAACAARCLFLSQTILSLAWLCCKWYDGSTVIYLGLGLGLWVRVQALLFRVWF